MSDLDDVVWDYGAADAAVRELRRMADHLEESIYKREASARDATAEWRGRHRDRFDVELKDMVVKARHLTDRCRNKAREIEDASRRARDEQRRREAERRRREWERLQEEWRRARGIE